MTQQGKRPHAQMRQSQLITTFGPGAMVDLPNHAVLIGGLEFWTEDRRPIHGSACSESSRRRSPSRA